MFHRTSGRSTIRGRTREQSLGYPLGVAAGLLGGEDEAVQFFQGPKKFFFLVA